MALILEIRDARGVASWHRLDALPLTIGRGLSNDIILDDPYLDARHARISLGAEGRIELEDLRTVNGLVTDGRRTEGPIAIDAGRELRAGRTILRFRDVDEAVPPALNDEPGRATVDVRRRAEALPAPPGATSPLVRLISTHAGRAAACVIMLAAFACNTWLSDTSRSSGSTVFSAVLAVGALVGLWAALWAAAGRAVVHRFQFLAHAAVASLAMIAMLAWGTVNEWLTFVFPDAKLAWLLYMGVFLIVLASLVSAHLALATAQPWRRQRRPGLYVAGAVVVLVVVAGLVSDDKFSDVPKFANELKPMSARWLPASSVSEFENAARELRKEVDEDAEKVATP